MEKTRISKLDAARRQIIAAIRLFFNDGDIVPIHTLAAAALKITQDICDSESSLPDSVADWFNDLLKPEFRGIFWKKFYEPANFFKHADRDPAGVLEISPGLVETVLFIATRQYLGLTSEQSAELMVFTSWYAVLHPDLFNTQRHLSRLGKDPILNDKKEFWREMIPLAQRAIDESRTDLGA